MLPTPLPPVTAALLARIRTQCESGRPEWQDSQAPESSISVERYFSEAIWAREIAHLFRPLPLIAAHSSELQAGQLLAHDSLGAPILLTRQPDGQVQAYLNVCRHRGTRLVAARDAAQTKASIVCPYHGWTYGLNGQLRHRLHAHTFDPKPCEQENLIPLPCEERHGLIWVVPDPKGSIDLDAFLGDLNGEMPFYGIENLQHFRSVHASYPANWKLIPDAFLESYHIRVLHRQTIAPFFSDGITASHAFGDHIHSLVARRAAQEWAGKSDAAQPSDLNELCQLVTPSQLIFPNTITIFHPDYLSLITLYPTSPETLSWTHKMLIPKDKTSPDWAAHWEKTFQLINHGVFEKEDIATAIGTQQGLKSGANTHLRAGRIEQGLGWFHASVQAKVD